MAAFPAVVERLMTCIRCGVLYAVFVAPSERERYWDRVRGDD